MFFLSYFRASEAWGVCSLFDELDSVIYIGEYVIAGRCVFSRGLVDVNIDHTHMCCICQAGCLGPNPTPSVLSVM